MVCLVRRVERLTDGGHNDDLLHREEFVEKETRLKLFTLATFSGNTQCIDLNMMKTAGILKAKGLLTPS